MKKYVFLSLLLLTADAVSHELETEANSTVTLLECLNTIPNDKIHNPEYQFTKSLSLFPIVLNQLSKENVSPEDRKLFKVISRYCKKEIQQVSENLKRTSEDNH
ncbi:MAG: hypothetical protein ACPGUD_05180 [Parashewanella sp.]